MANTNIPKILLITGYITANTPLETAKANNLVVEIYYVYRFDNLLQVDVKDNFCAVYIQRAMKYENVGLNVGLNKTEKRVIELLIENSSYTSEKLAEKIGVTKRTIERTFKKLQEEKMKERIGSKRDGNWIVIR